MALAQHFFGDHACDLPVLFLVDEGLLARLHPSEEPTIAVASLSQAVRRDLSPSAPNGFFDTFEKLGRRWRLAGGEGDPPFLHLLALCVLAAARMGTGNFAPQNYRSHLCGLLDLDDSHFPRGFDDSLDYLWNTLTWWLDDIHHGARGISTVTTDERFTHIGYPVSQTLFRGADVRRLDEFLRWFELEPGEEVDEAILVAHFRAWAPGRGLSPGAMRLLSEQRFRVVVGRIVAGYARQWDGTRAGSTGERRASLQVVVELSATRRVSLQAIQPAGFPDRLSGRGPSGATTVRALDGVLRLEGEAGPRQLLDGVSVSEAGCSLTLAGSDLHVLRLDPELGGWASVSAFKPRERHCLLVAPSLGDQLERQLDRVATDPIQVERAPGLLAAWSLIRNVVIDEGRALSGPLAGRRRPQRHRFVLRGGLPLAMASSYLEGGAPDAWLPPVDGDPPTLTLDGTALPSPTERVRLADHLRGDQLGTHRVVYADEVTRSFTLVESARMAPPESSRPGHELKLDEGGEVVGCRAVSETRDGTASVVGPHVRGVRDEWRDTPVLLRRHATEAWLLGAEPEQVMRVDPPPEPRWLRAYGLRPRLYEARAPFEVQYSVERRPSDAALRIRQHALLAPRPADRLGEETAAWARLLLQADPTGDHDPDLLASYRGIAANLEQELASA